MSNPTEFKSELSDNPDDVYAGMLKMYLPKFQGMVAKMSNKMLRRLINALIEFPLNQRDYNPKDPLEKGAFILGDRLLTTKAFLIISALREEEEANLKAAQEASQTETAVNETKETNVETS
jgi:hypothetical protein